MHIIKSINQYFFLSDKITLSDFAWFYIGILTMLAIATIVFNLVGGGIHGYGG